MKNRTLIILCLAVFILSLFYFFNKYHRRLSDTTIFGYDVWSYQSLGVNLCLGHGFQEGALETFSTYKFQNINPPNLNFIYFPPNGEKPEPLDSYFMKGGHYTFHRTPVYPFFLAIIYKLFGIHPRAVKITQIILLALTSAGLTLISYYYWKTAGFFCGLVSSFIFVIFIAPEPTAIMAESLLVFGLLLFAGFLIFWEEKPTIIKIFFLGMATTILIFIKAVNLFIPFIFLFYLFSKFKINSKSFFFCLAFTAGLMTLVVPWSYYASQKCKNFVLLSNEHKIILLDSYNPYTFKFPKNLSWNSFTKYRPNRAWRLTPGGKNIFNQLTQNKISSLKYALDFLVNSPDLAGMLFFKLIIFLTDNYYQHSFLVIYIILLMFIFYLAHWSGKFTNLNQKEKVPLFPLIYFFNLLIISLIFFGFYRLTKPFLPFFLIPAVYCPFFMARLIWSLIKKRS